MGVSKSCRADNVLDHAPAGGGELDLAEALDCVPIP